MVAKVPPPASRCRLTTLMHSGRVAPRRRGVIRAVPSGKKSAPRLKRSLLSTTITINVVASYRQHLESVSRIEIPPAHWYIVALRMLWRDPKFRTHRPHLRKKLASLFKQNMHHHGVRGERKLALKAAAQAVLRSPFGGRLRENVVSVLVGHS